MSTVLRGWRVFMPVVVGNAVVQAATTVPFLTPGEGLGFVALAVVSAAALVVGAVLIVAAAAAVAGVAGVSGSRVRMPRRLWLAASVSVVLVGTAAVTLYPLVPVVLTLAFIVLPGLARGELSSGFVAFVSHPGRAVLLTVLTLLTVALLWVGALLLGFFITGAVSAALTWLAFGAAAVELAKAWAAMAERASPPTSPLTAE